MARSFAARPVIPARVRVIALAGLTALALGCDSDDDDPDAATAPAGPGPDPSDSVGETEIGDPAFGDEPLVVRELATLERFLEAARATSVIGFDDREAGSELAGDAYPGVSIEARRIAVVDPLDPAPRLLLGAENVSSAPHGVSASLFYGGGESILFDDLDDRFRFVFDDPVHAAGLWIGNLGAAPASGGATPTSVRVLDADGRLVAAETLTADGVEVIGAGANNRTFYGVLSNRPFTSVELDNPPADADGIIVDDLRFQVPPTALGSLCDGSCAPGDGLSAFVGTWSGPVDQPSSSRSPYDARMIVRSGPDGTLDGEIDYPDLACAGTLDRFRQDGEEVVFRETIVSGRGNCVDQGTVRLRALTDDTLTWRYRRPDREDVTASATLTRE